MQNEQYINCEYLIVYTKQWRINITNKGANMAEQFNLQNKQVNYTPETIIL